MTTKFKICKSCVQSKPLVDFIAADSKEKEHCNSCRGYDPSVQYIKKLYDQVRSYAKEVVTKAKKGTLDMTRTHEIATAVMNRLGGLDTFATLWASQINEAATDGKTSKKCVLDACYAIFKMHSESSKHIEATRDTDLMNREEIEEELERIMAEGLVAKIHEPPDQEIA